MPLQTLVESGRWHERCIPIGDGSRYVIIANFYGISASFSCEALARCDERLIAAAVCRAASFISTPYFVMGDFNATQEDAGLATLTGPRFFSALPRGAVTTTLNPAKGHPERVIDHIFVEQAAFIPGEARRFGLAATDRAAAEELLERWVAAGSGRSFLLLL